MFVTIKSKTGQKELVTAATAVLDGTILMRLTSNSIFVPAREKLLPKKWEMLEHTHTINELVEASEKRRLLEASRQVNPI